MAGAQRFINGITVDLQRGRFAGAFDLEEYDVDAAGLDEVGIAVVVFRVGAATPKITRKGELEQVSVFNVQEMRIVDAELGEALVARLGLLSGLEGGGVQLSLGDGQFEPPANAFDPDTGEVFEPEPVAAAPPAAAAPSDSAHMPKSPLPDPPGPAAPVPEPVREPIPAGVGANGTRVGAVYPEGRKDPELAKFLDA